MPLALLGLALAACVGQARPPVADDAPPRDVLVAYLRALRSGDCPTGRTLTSPPFGTGDGDLCGDATVTGATVDGDPARPTADEVVFATTLTTTGTGDGSVPAGEITWFYDLRLQPDGTWRIVGGGSGP